MVKSISVKQLSELSNINIIDIRSTDKYNISHIEGSINMPYSYLINNYDLLEKDKLYYIYCDSGIKSMFLCQFLDNKGYNVINILGGYNSYLNNFKRG